MTKEPLLGEFTALFGQWVECRGVSLKGTLPDDKMNALTERGSELEHQMARTPALGFTEVRHKIEVLRNIVAEGGSPKHVDLARVDSLDLDILGLYEDVAEQALRRGDGGGGAA